MTAEVIVERLLEERPAERGYGAQATPATALPANDMKVIRKEGAS